MENLSTEELKAYLMESNVEYRQMAQEHANYKRLIEAIEAKSHLTPEDEVEEHRLKKLKLALKDQMLSLVERQRAQRVA